jgi:hypothetical protein
MFTVNLNKFFPSFWLMLLTSREMKWHTINSRL